MWWCCGKPGKDMPGCKFRKHESKEDEDDDQAEDQEAAKLNSMKYVRCTCCKEIGHSIGECTRDPNLKTGHKPDEEFDRIQKMKDFRKLFANSVAQTTHLLKKAVMIPIKYDEEGRAEENVNAYNPFMRGVMEFDDFNYTVHNPYILVEDPKLVEEDAEVKDKPPYGLDQQPRKTHTAKQMDPIVSISEKSLDAWANEEYTHDLVTI